MRCSVRIVSIGDFRRNARYAPKVVPVGIHRKGNPTERRGPNACLAPPSNFYEKPPPMRPLVRRDVPTAVPLVTDVQSPPFHR